MRTSSRSAVARIVAATVVLALVLGTVAPAFAVTNKAIEAKRKEAAQAQTQLDQLQTDLEMRGEELGQIEDAVTKTRQQIQVAEADLASATAEVERTTQLLDTRAASMYRNGTVNVVAVFLGATSFQDFISRLDLLRRIGMSDASLVSQVKDARDRVETAKSALEAREAEQVALREQARVKAEQVQQALSAQQAFLSTLNGQLKKLIAQEQARQAKLAAERAARLAAAQRAAAAAAHGRILPFDASALGAGHSDVVAIARKYLGVPYVWGGTSPSGFDCSGLCQYCYAQLGVSLPRTSREQFHAGAYIPPNRLDLLKPGDLVFFGVNADPDQIHHVGIFAGGDEFIEAPFTGGDVRVSSLSGRIASRGDYVGACRP